MMTSGETGFYVQLLSHANTHEYPQNKSNSFKNRLPYALRFQERPWKVGLCGVSFPPMIEKKQLRKWGNRVGDVMRIGDLRNGGREKWLDDYGTEDVDMKHVTDGVTLISSFINTYYQKSYHTATPSGPTRFLRWFRWEGNEVIIDNAHLRIAGYITSPPSNEMHRVYNTAFEVNFALDMGWIQRNLTGSGYTLGPNLVPENYRKNSHGDNIEPNDLDGNGSYWLVQEVKDVKHGEVVIWFGDDGLWLKLSVYCDWRMRNLDTVLASKPVDHVKQLLVHSDLSTSMMMGDKITDVLREVYYSPELKYFEPHHIHYKPLRSTHVDIAKIEVKDYGGKLASFEDSEVPTAVTLHFKYV